RRGRVRGPAVQPLPAQSPKRRPWCGRSCPLRVPWIPPEMDTSALEVGRQRPSMEARPARLCAKNPPACPLLTISSGDTELNALKGESLIESKLPAKGAHGLRYEGEAGRRLCTFGKGRRL